MTTATTESDRQRLRAIALRVMRERGLEPEFTAEALDQVAAMTQAPTAGVPDLRDLRTTRWCSIDNDESRDLDQVTSAERRADGSSRVLIGIADVDALVGIGSFVDRHAACNTTSVYTPAVMFPMLPERLSTDLTSLAPGEDRLAVVVELTFSAAGEFEEYAFYRALVRNHAQLTYDGVDAWLTGRGPLPPRAAAVHGLDAQLRIQDETAQALSVARHEHGALDLEMPDVRAHFDGDRLADLQPETSNRAKSLIENLMIAANGVTARFLDSYGLPTMRRVVRAPARWERLVELAAGLGSALPPAPDAEGLAAFLAARREMDPEGYAELSHTVVKLIGRGEYVVDPFGASMTGHFGLAVRDYTHSTAPNRRYPDLLTQRLVKAAIRGRRSPYPATALEILAGHCTAQEDAAHRVERQVKKSAAALLMAPRLGQNFDAVVTGASTKGTFVRLPMPPVEGMLVRGAEGADVGDRVNVQLAAVDVDRGFIDFVR